MTNESNPNQKPAGNSKEVPHEGHDTSCAGAEADRPALCRHRPDHCAVVFAALGIFGVLSRIHHNNVLAKTTQEAAAPVVIALAPKAGASTNEFMLPGNVTAYTDSPIYARTSGYLTRWYYDIGSHVKKGALLAEIATPELDQQLSQAQADLGTAEANAKNAHSQAERYQGLVKSNAVSHQDTDTFVNQAAATASAVHSAQANVDRLTEMQSFEKVYAPFDGVVTARTVDTGQLIDTGLGEGTVSHAGDQHPARLHQCAPAVHHESETRIEDRHHFPRIWGTKFSGHAGANCGRHRSLKPHVAGRD